MFLSLIDLTICKINVPKEPVSGMAKRESAKWNINGKVVIHSHLENKRQFITSVWQMSDKFLTEEDPLINNFINLLKIPKGSISVKTNDTPAFSLEFQGDKVLLDITDASFFNFGEESDAYWYSFKAKNRKETSWIYP